MQVLALAKTKGGVGSTTLAACLAVEASRHHKRVGILDCDPQRSLERWWHTRAGEAQLGLGDRRLELVEHERHLDDTLAKARDGDFDVLVIDGPPGNIDVTELVIEAADFVLIASQPSPLDVGAMDAVVALVREADRPYAFILTRTTARAVSTPEAADFLSTLGEVMKDKASGELLEIRDRIGYQAAMLRGATLPEIEPKGKAPKPATVEIGKLWDALDAKLRKAARARERVAS